VPLRPIQDECYCHNVEYLKTPIDKPGLVIGLYRQAGFLIAYIVNYHKV
jgi:hypothetical protein